MRKVLLAVAPVQTRHRIRITRLVLPYGLGGPGSGGRPGRLPRLGHGTPSQSR
jgi:hypothetical protein